MITLRDSVFLLLLLTISAHLSGQDIIIKRNLDSLNCKVKEIGANEIKYSLKDYPADVLFTLPKEKINKIKFENGKEMSFSDEMSNPANYLGQNKNAIKLEFLSPLTGNLTFAYERSLKPGQSIEATMGIIGLGFDPNDFNPVGCFVKFGMKFIKSPDFYLQGMRYAHVLKGSYLKPEIGFAYFTKDEETYNPRYPYEYTDTERKEYISMVAQIVLGKQWIVNDIVLVDFYGGVGYGFDDRNGNYHYGYAIVTDIPLSFSAGLKIGFLF